MSPRRSLRAAVLTALLLGLAGCAGLPERGPNTAFAERNWGIRQTNLAAVQQFGLRGRVAERGIAGTRGDLDWTQNGDRLALRITGPLGVGALAIDGDSRELAIRSKDGVQTTRDLAMTMQRELGWSLPIRDLRYWVLGVPAPPRDRDERPPQVLLDDRGLAQRFDQHGWRVEFEDYGPAGSTVLPGRLSLSDGGRRFRLLIDQWREIP